MSERINTAASAREILERHFRPEEIQTRPSAHGPLSFVAAWRVVARLNEAYPAGWSYEISSYEVRDDVVLVVGKLITPDFTKTAFGSATVSRHKETGEVVDLGDSVKAAMSDSLKKAASWAGCGLHLWADGAMDEPANNANAGPANGDNARVAANGTNGRAAQGDGNGSPASANGSNGNGVAPASKTGSNGPTRLSAKQLAMIYGVARARGLTKDDVQAMAVHEFERMPDFLTKQQASQFITRLQATAA